MVKKTQDARKKAKSRKNREAERKLAADRQTYLMEYAVAVECAIENAAKDGKSLIEYSFPNDDMRNAARSDLEFHGYYCSEGWDARYGLAIEWH